MTSLNFEISDGAALSSPINSSSIPPHSASALAERSVQQTGLNLIPKLSRPIAVARRQLQQGLPCDYTRESHAIPARRSTSPISTVVRTRVRTCSGDLRDSVAVAAGCPASGAASRTAADPVGCNRFLHKAAGRDNFRAGSRVVCGSRRLRGRSSEADC